MKKALTVVLSVILWVVIIIAALFAFTTLATKDANKVASIAGYTPLSVQSDSMVPTFEAGDLIIVKSCDPSSLEVGDIITFHTIIENVYALNTHRIVKIENVGSTRVFTTRGDNNIVDDIRVITESDVVGIYVTKVPVIGKILDFISSSVGFLVCIVLPMLIFFGYQVYHLIVVSIQLKKAVALETAQAVQEATATDADAKLAEAQRLAAEAEAKLAEAQRLAAMQEKKE